MKKTAVMGIILLLAASRAEACYSPREFEAEQGVRIHSELMVIGLTCLKMPQGQELYGKYKTFTEEHAGLIAGYEADLIGYYTRQGDPSPEQKLHALRTNIANEISQRAVSMSMMSFCQQFSPRIDQALSMDEQKLRRWAQKSWPNQPPSEPVCRL